MNTTYIFVELLVIGFGATIWLTMGMVFIFKWSIYDISSNLNLYTLTPVAGLVYVLGIIIDRAAFFLFNRLDMRIKGKVMQQKDYFPNETNIVRYIICSSEPLKNRLEYNRSRLRICRSWVLNFFFIAGFSILWINQTNYFAFPIIISVLSILTFFVWYTLTEDYYKEIKDSYNFLINKK